MSYIYNSSTNNFAYRLILFITFCYQQMESGDAVIKNKITEPISLCSQFM